MTNDVEDQKDQEENGIFQDAHSQVEDIKNPFGADINPQDEDEAPQSPFGPPPSIEDITNPFSRKEDEKNKKGSGFVDKINTAYTWGKRAKWASGLFNGGAGAAGTAAAGEGAAAGAAGAAATGAAAGEGAAAGGAIAVGTLSTGWVVLIVAIIVIIILLAFILIKGSFNLSRSSSSSTGTNINPNPTSAPVCGTTGSLDYSIPFRDSTIKPDNVNSIQEQIVASWPNAELYNWDHIVARSVEEGWNPAFILTLWIEESGAQGASGYSDALGCGVGNPTTDINRSLGCVFNSFRNYQNFEDFMCVYGGDGFHKAPCTFTTENPNFPVNIKSWYTKLSASTISPASQSKTCNVSTGTAGDWPTSGYILQGPKGTTDHARLSTYGWNAIDIANPSSPPIKSTFDGTVTGVHDCVVDGGCSNDGTGGYRGLGSSVEITTNSQSGSFVTTYGHLSQILTTQGSTVKVGDTIGIMGNTGHSGGTHLHYQFEGTDMAPPNIPKAINPPECDWEPGLSGGVKCDPDQVEPGAVTPVPTPAV